MIYIDDCLYTVDMVGVLVQFMVTAKSGGGTKSRWQWLSYLYFKFSYIWDLVEHNVEDDETKHGEWK